MEFDGVPLEHLNATGRWYQLMIKMDSNTSFNISEQLTRMENKMADVEAVLESFRAAVDKEILDDRAQNDLISLLQGQVANADGLVQAARDGETSAKAQVDALLVELENATGLLNENDLPDAPTDPETGEPVEPDVPDTEVPTEPEVPDTEVPDTEVPDTEVPTEPIPGEVEGEVPVTEPEAPVTEPAPDAGEAVEGEGTVNPDEADQPEGPTPTPDNPFPVSVLFPPSRKKSNTGSSLSII